MRIPADSARAGIPASGRIPLFAFAALSLLAHASLLALLWRDPDPLASIGIQAISVEIVVGATDPAGVAPTPAKQENPIVSTETKSEAAEPAQASEQRATEQPQTVPVAKLEAAPAQPSALEATPESLTRTDVTPAPKPAPQAEKPVQQKMQQQQRPVARPAPTPSRIAAPTQERASERTPAAAPAPSASSTGVGRSQTNVNYAGLVASHLARYKQYPADARSRGERGTAAVAFSLDGSGRVTSARLARSSGVASIDQEVVAMVYRASPFPAPPDGRPQAFSVPVNFSLR